MHRKKLLTKLMSLIGGKTYPNSQPDKESKSGVKYISRAQFKLNKVVNHVEKVQ